MYRIAARSASRPVAGCLRSAAAGRLSSRRLASTASPADRPRSWKSSALRWGLVAGAFYYYSTSSVFAEEASSAHSIPAPPPFADSDLPTVDSVIEEKRKKLQARLDRPAEKTADGASEKTAAAAETQPGSQAQSTVAVEGSPEAAEEDAGQQGAFNPETGEINWDCPCLGGMAHGPCGEQFKTAFSCFVYSEEEPKGMDCIEKFQGMQECFREYPDIYGAELQDDEEDEGIPDGAVAAVAGDHQQADAATRTSAETKSLSVATETPSAAAETPTAPVAEPTVTAAVETATTPVNPAPSEAALPKWEDATEANKEVEKEDKQ